jgi:hypothetical protein
MIQTCKYCASQLRSCDECHGPVISRTITEFIPSEPFSIHATFLLCLNLDCKEYAHFNREHAEHNESYVCSSVECQEQAKLYNPKVLRERTL